MRSPTVSPTILSEEQVSQLLPDQELLQVVEQALVGVAHGQVLSGDATALTLKDDNGLRTFKAMPGALLQRSVAGVKWVGTFSANPARGLPRAPATILLSDSVDGTFLGLVAATELTSRRTAAMAAIAVKHLASPAPKTAAVLGFGAIGKSSVSLLSNLFPGAEFRVWGRTYARVEHDAAMLAKLIDRPITVASDPTTATVEADIVIVASGLTEDAPFLHHRMLRDGTVVCALGSYQEIGHDVIEAADVLIADDWNGLTKRGNLAPAIKAGRLSRLGVDSDLASVVAGGIARSKPSRLSLVALIGMGAIDVALAAHVLAAHQARSAQSREKTS